MQKLTLNGHQINPVRADEFISGLTGQPITDEQWDESKARLQADNSHLIPEQFRGR